MVTRSVPFQGSGSSSSSGAVGVVPGTGELFEEISKEGKPIPDQAAARSRTALKMRMMENSAATRNAPARMRMIRLEGLRRFFACGFRLGFILPYPCSQTSDKITMFCKYRTSHRRALDEIAANRSPI